MSIGQRRARSESRVPVLVAQLAAVALFVLLPGVILPLAIRLGVAAVVLVALLPLLAINPSRLRHSARWTRVLGVTQSIALSLAALGAVVEVVVRLVDVDYSLEPRVLVAALQAWLMQAIAASIVFWQLDRSGPVARRFVGAGRHSDPDFRFPAETDDEHFTPSYLDYLTLAVTNAMAVVPTRAIPLRGRVKLLTAVWSFTSFVLVGVVLARIVAFFA